MSAAEDRKLQQLALGHVAQGHLTAVEVVELAGEIRALGALPLRSLLTVAFNETVAASIIARLQRDMACRDGQRTMTVRWAYDPRVGSKRLRLLVNLLSNAGTPTFANLLPGNPQPT